MNELPGIDASFGELTPAIAAELWNRGVRVFAQCLWTGIEPAPSIAVANLRVAKAQGFITIGYISLTSAFTGPWHVDRARKALPAEIWDALTLRPIDIELGGIDNGQIAAALLEARGRPCIYTSPSKWRDNQGDSQQFSAAGVLLWLAQYDGIAYRGNVDLPGGWGYGQLVGKQYTNTQTVTVGDESIDVDFDTWDGDLLMEDTIMDPAIQLALRQRDALRQLAAAADDDDMQRAVELLIAVGVLPPGTAALKPSILAPLS